MTNKSDSQLPAQTGANVADGDLVATTDVSDTSSVAESGAGGTAKRTGILDFVTNTILPRLALRALNDGGSTTINTATPGVVKVDLNPEPSITDLFLAGGGTKVVAVAYMTTAALPALTYANGTSGVGATLTATANGALAAQDGITPAANDLILVAHQASAFQNGLYVVTQVGDGSHPFILTRDIRFDEAVDLDGSVFIHVASGLEHAGRALKIRNIPTTFVIGTTPIMMMTQTTLGDVSFGILRNRQSRVEDFDGFNATVTATGTSAHIPGARGILLGTGTGAQASQQDLSAGGGGESVNGVMQVETGTTTTGEAFWSMTTLGVAFDVNNRWEFFAKPKIPTASDGTNTFNVKIGFMDTSDVAPASGIYFEARNGQTNWLAVCRQAGTETTQDTGIAYNTAFRSFNMIAPGDGHAYFYNAGAQVANISTNLPLTPLLLPGFGILKSAGTTSRTLRMDIFSCDLPSGANTYVT